MNRYCDYIVWLRLQLLPLTSPLMRPYLVYLAQIVDWYSAWLPTEYLREALMFLEIGLPARYQLTPPPGSVGWVWPLGDIGLGPRYQPAPPPGFSGLPWPLGIA